MRLIEISKQPNGAHNNQTISHLRKIPEGWAVIPEDMVCENFPFGEVTAEEIDGVMTVTSWTAGEMPEAEPMPEAKPTAQEDTDAMLVDHEYRITLLELEV